MKINFFSLIISGLLVAGLTSCGNKQNAQQMAQEEPEPVSDASASLGNVQVKQDQLVSKGVIKSVTDIAIYTELQKKIVESNLKEGKLVQKGQVLVKQDDEEIRTDIEKARNEFEQAQYNYMEILIGQGYKRDDFDQAPQTVKDQAMIKCNYQAAKLNLEIAEKQLEKTVIKAPCNGAMSQVKVHQFDMPSGDPICHIVDTENLKVEFHILETELRKLSNGSVVNVVSVAYPDEPHEATVSSISVIVDENGMVQVEALLKDPTHLMPGMTAIVNF